MKIKIVAVLAVILLVTIATAESSWAWNQEDSFSAPTAGGRRRRSEEPAVEKKAEDVAEAKQDQQPEGEGRHLYSEQEIYSNDTSTADDIVDFILDSSRQGRNLDGYDEVYADPKLQEALQRGDDTEARNVIRDTLCNLGLMSCDGPTLVKRPFGPPPGFPGAGPPRGPYGPPRPMPPPGKYGPNTFGPPPSKFGPPPSSNFGPPPSSNFGPPPSSSFGPPPPLQSGPGKYGPPRKVGYEGPPVKQFPGPIYPGPQASFGSDYEFSKPPPGASIIYGSKPPGPIVSEAEPPFQFESFGEKIHHQHGFEQSGFHSEGQLSTGKPTIVVNAQGGAAGATTGAQPNAPLQQHVHHHFHHVDNKNPGGSGPLSTGNEIAGDLASISGASGFDFKNQQTGSVLVGAGFSAASNGEHLVGGFNGVNSGKGPNGLYTSIRPVIESGFNPSVNPGLGSYGTGGFSSPGSAGINDGSFGHSASATFGGSSGFNGGSNGFNSGSSGFNGGSSGFNGGSNGFNGGSNGFNGASNNFNPGFGTSGGASFHSSSPEYYKKELNFNGAGQNGIYSNGGANKYNQFNNGEAYQGFETARQGAFDCVCVPYEQCPAADRLGRKDDLILPIDPRNLGKDIEALSDDVPANNTAVAESKSSEELKSQEGDEPKKVSKRDVAEAQDKVAEDAIDNAADVEPRVSVPVSNFDIKKRKILPTFGVSFGLPQPSGAYPFNTFGGHPAQNPYFGAIGPNGLNLGLLNVNPLLSLQVTKSEYGEKLVKPLVNLHVTPNEHLIHKVGEIFQSKKEIFLNQHDHYHEHQHYPPPPPIFHPGPPHHHHHHPHHLPPPPPPHHHHHHGHPSGPEFYAESVPSFEVGSYGYPQQFYKDSTGYATSPSHEDGSNHLYSQSEHPGDGFQPFGDEYYKRSSNVSNAFAFPSSGYAGQYRYNNRENGYNDPSRDQFQQIPTQVPGHAGGGKNVAFPNSRKRRSPGSQNEVIIEKRQAFYGGRPQQCRSDQVCCRRPIHQQQHQQFGRCGTRNAHGITGRIKNPVYVDGDSEFGEYPWQAAILKKDPKESVYVCGGTIIDNQHILTAAHCIKTHGGFDLRVRLGEWDVNHDVEFFPYIERDIISVHVHPEYYAGTLDNDLAILKLDQPIDFTKSPHITPACLPDKFSDFAGHRCWTTGWGKDAFGSFGKYQNILKEVDVPVLSNQQCQNQLRQTRLGYSYNLNPGFVCAGGEEGKDACKGDGGGPMVCEHNGIWQLVGVVSWGIGCGQVNVPGVYVRVSHYLDWIHQITRNY